MQDRQGLINKTESVTANLMDKTIQNSAIKLEDNRPKSILQKKANNTGLPDNLKSGIENLSGHAMDDVKVHYNSDKPAQLNAHAYAQGSQIHIANGQEKHLPHEAWHVVQQKQGRVKPTMQMKGKVNVNDDEGLEKEADMMGGKAIQRNASETLTATATISKAALSINEPVVQAYSDMSKGLVFGYGKGRGAAAPQFEFQKQEVNKTNDDTTATTRYDMDTMQSFVDAPNMKVSDNYNMAVPNSAGAESKSFFATPGLIAASNVALGIAGAPLTLAGGAGQITLPSLWNPFGIALHQVTPVLALGLITSSECGTFANNILGVNVQRIQLLTGMGGAPQNTVLPSAMGRDAALNNALGGQKPEDVGANKNANPNIGEGFGIFARHVVPPIGLMQQLWNEITTVHGLFSEKKTHMQWGEHWAGVVAKSGGDFVTLENYNRNAIAIDVLLEQLEKDYKEIDAAGGLAAFTQGTAQYAKLPDEWRYQRLARLGLGYMKYAVELGTITGFYANQIHNMWYFAMYGSEKQSFHETWKKSAPNSVTTKVT
jgi:hypothetical protein